SSTISTWESSTANQNAFPEIQQQYDVNSTDFTELNAQMSNLSAWQALPITIGCLTCDGQGFEFLGILTDNQLKYSVMFQYNSTIPDFESFVSLARAIREQYIPSGGASTCTCTNEDANTD
ncbi:unnamed protein product, partial [Rotaria magnacalcarata]